MPELKNSTALVTGGGAGLGRDFAIALAAQGAAVAVTGRQPAPILETQRIIEQAGGRCMALVADASDAQAAQASIARASDALGPIDLLVNNAALITPMGLEWEVDADEWWHLFEVNLRGPFLHARAVIPGMISRGRGRIINVSSHGAYVPTPFAAAYGASKAALTHWTSCIAPTLAPHGVKAFSFGPVGATGMTRKMADEAGTPEAMRARHIRHLEHGDPRQEKSVAMLLFIASGGADALYGRHISWDDDPQWLAAQTDRIIEEDLLKLTRRTLR